MNKMVKKLVAFCLAMAVVTTSVVEMPLTVSAQTGAEKIATSKGKKTGGTVSKKTAKSTGGKIDIQKDKVIGEFSDRAEADETYAIDFTNVVERSADIIFKVSTPCNMDYLVVDAKGREYEGSVSTSDWSEDASGDASTAFYLESLAKGDGTIYLTFDADVGYSVAISIYGVNAYMFSSYTVTKGFTYKLYVYGGYGEKVTSWSSSKKSVATVSKKGVVTGKKTGSCTIYAKLSNGKKLKTKVTVKANSWSWSVPGVGDISYGNYYFGLKKAELNSKGNLVVTYRVINGTTNYYLTKVAIQLTVTHIAKNKQIAYISTTKKLNLGHRKKKDIKVTIPKKKLKIKKFDLRKEGINFYTYRDIYYKYK